VRCGSVVEVDHNFAPLMHRVADLVASEELSEPWRFGTALVTEPSTRCVCLLHQQMNSPCFIEDIKSVLAGPTEQKDE
jgi:hypothetical protein